jgi:hypothetical protein
LPPPSADPADIVIGAAVEVTADGCSGRQLMGGSSGLDRVPRTYPPLSELQPFAVAAFALAVLGEALAALPRPRIRTATATALASAAACLIAATVLASMDVPTPYLGSTKAVMQDIPLGACLAFVLLAALAVWNLVSVVRALRSRHRTSPADGR